MAYPKIVRDIFENEGAGPKFRADKIPTTFSEKADILSAATKAATTTENSSPGTVDIATVLTAVSAMESRVAELEVRVHIIEHGHNADYTQWYEKWSNGKMVVEGYRQITSSAGTSPITTKFAWSFAAPPRVLITDNSGSGDASSGYSSNFQAWGVAKDGFIMQGWVDANLSATKSWLAIGSWK